MLVELILEIVQFKFTNKKKKKKKKKKKLIALRVTVIDPSVGYIITTFPVQNVFELNFSPLGTYLITWERPSKDENGNPTKNLKVWRVVEAAEHTVVGSFVQKSQTSWNLQHTADERLCARAVTNEVQFYESNDLEQAARGRSDGFCALARRKNAFGGRVCAREERPAGLCQGVSGPFVCHACFAKELLQGRQSAVEVECFGDYGDCACADGCGSIGQELLRRDDLIFAQRGGRL